MTPGEILSRHGLPAADVATAVERENFPAPIRRNERGIEVWDRSAVDDAVTRSDAPFAIVARAFQSGLLTRGEVPAQLRMLRAGGSMEASE